MQTKYDQLSIIYTSLLMITSQVYHSVLCYMKYSNLEYVLAINILIIWHGNEIIVTKLNFILL